MFFAKLHMFQSSKKINPNPLLFTTYISALHLGLLYVLHWILVRLGTLIAPHLVANDKFLLVYFAYRRS